MSGIDKVIEFDGVSRASRYVDKLKGQLHWYDNMQPPQGGFPAIQTEFGPVIFAGFAFAPPGNGIRHARPHDYRLMGALNPGVTAREYDIYGEFMYALALKLGAKPQHLVELTNTFLTKGYAKAAAESPLFKTPEGVLLTLSWPYIEEIQIVAR